MPVDPNAPITEFRHEYRFLSNFWPARVQLGMYSFPTVEHAYQAAKTTDRLIQEAIREAESPSMAKRIGSKVTLRPDWDSIRLEIMADLLWQKFVINRELRSRLLATGERQLINGVGENHLGRLLMHLRAIGQYIVDNQLKQSDEYQELHVGSVG